MKIITVVGARPNFMKVAPIIAAVDAHNQRGSTEAPIRHVLVHTGQHYDDVMSGSFFRDLNLPAPDVHLGVGSGSHAAQTAEIMKKFDEVLVRERPDVVVVVGDVNSTLACALVAAKVAGDPVSRPLIAHVEAGLRSFDRSMPEEVNRVLTDHVSDLLFVTEDSGVQNLRREGIAPEKIHFVGNTMIDSLLAFKDKAETSTVLSRLGLRPGPNGAGASITPYALLTLHRPSNVDDRTTLLNVLTGLDELARRHPIVFPTHPRTQKRISEFGLGDTLPGLVMTDPLGYLDFLCLMRHAALVVTDSGGIQEETTCLGVPCVTVRENTERPVTVERGTNTLAGTKTEGIRDAIRRQMARTPREGVPPHWDGHAASRIVDVLTRAHAARTPSRPALATP
jgi:UDP-N-acetylglucosamine 2-epimerase (non-hydrolysing)